jgi:TonB family protein
MFENRLFWLAVIASLAVHSLILAQNFNLTGLPYPERPKLIEVKFQKNSGAVNRLPSPRPQGLRDEPFLNLNARITANPQVAPPRTEREKLLSGPRQAQLKEPVFAKPALIKPELAVIKKKVSLPPLDLDKINNPSYISYYQIVREKIRRAAYQNYAYSETGEIYLTFIITSQGYVKGVRLIEEKSRGGDYLRQIALRSVQDASPFPSFPKDLDYPSLTFNVVISFEIE